MESLTHVDIVMMVGLAANFLAIMSYPIRVEHRLTKNETLLHTVDARVKLISRHLFENNTTH